MFTLTALQQSWKSIKVFFLGELNIQSFPCWCKAKNSSGIASAFPVVSITISAISPYVYSFIIEIGSSFVEQIGIIALWSGKCFSLASLLFTTKISVHPPASKNLAASWPTIPAPYTTTLFPNSIPVLRIPLIVVSASAKNVASSGLIS